MSFKIDFPVEGVIHIVFKTMKDLTHTMFRIEEYYESPFESLRRKFFTVGDFLEAYGDESGDVSYFSSWTGFNVPRSAIEAFRELFQQDLTNREKQFFEVVDNFDPQYVIASCESTQDSVLDHELAHARWAIDADYKQKVISLLSYIPEDLLGYMVKKLLDSQYPADSDIMLDELHAYLKTDGASYFLEKKDPEYELLKHVQNRMLDLDKGVYCEIDVLL